MDYDQARPLIQTGDLIAVKGRNFFAKGVRLVTGSAYSHTAIALWDGSRLLVAQSNAGGCCLVPLSQYCDGDFDVYASPANRATVESCAWQTVGKRIAYSIADLVRIAAHLWLHVPLPDQDDGGRVCSSLSAFIYQQAGWRPAGLPSIPWPGALAAALGGTPLLEVARK
jgi:hypothetical protein